MTDNYINIEENIERSIIAPFLKSRRNYVLCSIISLLVFVIGVCTLLYSILLIQPLQGSEDINKKLQLLAGIFLAMFSSGCLVTSLTILGACLLALYKSYRCVNVFEQ